MLIVVALGGNALLRRGEAMTAENQRRNIGIAADALAVIAERHQLVVAHGNGPQVGLLALQGAAYDKVETYPLDVLGAQTEGMIGYMIEQELGNRLAFERPFATLLTMVEVDPYDPAFSNPTKFIGPIYGKDEADRLAAEKQWVFKQDGAAWRRVVASPMPKRIFEIRPIKWLLQHNTIVIAAGGGGPGVGAARARARGRSLRDVDRRRGRLHRLGHAEPAADSARASRRARGHGVCRRLDGTEGGGRLPLRGRDGEGRRHRRTRGSEPHHLGRSGNHRVGARRRASLCSLTAAVRASASPRARRS